jgi:hypothetical protein
MTPATSEHSVTLDQWIAPASHVRRFQRIVTGVNGAGRSAVVRDGETSSIHAVVSTPTFVVINLRKHNHVPMDNDGAADDGLGGQVIRSPSLDRSFLRMVGFEDADRLGGRTPRPKVLGATPRCEELRC